MNNIIKGCAKSCLVVMFCLALFQPWGIDRIDGMMRIVLIVSETLISFADAVIVELIAIYVLRLRMETFSLKNYVMGSLARAVMLVPLISVTLLAFQGYGWKGDALAFLVKDGELMFHPFLFMCMCVASLMLVVFVFMYYSIKNDKLKRELDNIRAINTLLEERQRKLSEEDTTDEASEQDLSCTIVGQGVGATIELNPKNLIYVESMANYAEVCYIKDGETRHTTLRITLKQIRETLDAYDWVVQCHRAFLVNINFVVNLSSRSTGCQLKVFGMDKEIPVSRANTETIKNLLESK
ncbi:MAG: LytTR family transcriptional regulator [Bacteroidaceae bacterium]|nr:LytTR family transcriptional regulator [Bacteroidaceae bacterium]